MFIFSAGIGFTSCNNNNKNKENTNVNIDSNNANRAPVEISADAQLERGVRDAIKDHPGVEATVSGGVINLNGTIEREKWVSLKQTLDGLNPKRVNAESLTIK